jgi:hypothetical protein
MMTMLPIFGITYISNVTEAQSLTPLHKRDLTLELEQGGSLQTKGELTIPEVGGGPFPAALLIHGFRNLMLLGINTMK